MSNCTKYQKYIFRFGYLHDKNTGKTGKFHNYSQTNDSTWRWPQDPSHHTHNNYSAVNKLQNNSDKCHFNNVTRTNPERVHIAGLFDIHGRGSENSGKECSDYINSDAVQNLEAMLYAIKQV